ncbi:hypothetical protein CN200_31545, partial [Sinorhizobium meliloti]
MKLPTPIPPEGPRQMIMAFDSVKTRGMSPRQRETALMALAMLLMEAACVAADSDEAAPLFRDDCAPGFRDDLAPCLVGSAGD